MVTPDESKGRNALSDTGTLPRWKTPPEIAREIRVDVHHVLSEIKVGRLVAIDVRRPGASRARYRVSPEALEDYLRLLQVVPPPPRPSRRPRILKRYFRD